MCLCLFVPCTKICVQLGSRHVSLSVTASAAHLSVVTWAPRSPRPSAPPRSSLGADGPGAPTPAPAPHCCRAWQMERTTDHPPATISGASARLLVFSHISQNITPGIDRPRRTLV